MALDRRYIPVSWARNDSNRGLAEVNLIYTHCRKHELLI